MSHPFLHVVHEFGLRLGMSGLRLDEDGHCQLAFDDLHVHIQLLEANGQVLCYVPLGRLDAVQHAARAWELLEANYLYRRTHGATLSWDRSSGACLLTLLLDGTRIDTTGFESAMQALVNTADHWTRRLQTTDQPDDATPPLSAQPQPPTAFLFDRA